MATLQILMSVHKELLQLVVVKDAGTLMEVLSVLVMWDTKHIMMIQPFVLV